MGKSALSEQIKKQNCTAQSLITQGIVQKVQLVQEYET